MVSPDLYGTSDVSEVPATAVTKEVERLLSMRINPDAYNKLKDRERDIVKHAVRSLNDDLLSHLNVEKIAVIEYGVYNDANRKKIKRAINGLIEKRILRRKGDTDMYELNSNIAWR